MNTTVAFDCHRGAAGPVDAMTAAGLDRDERPGRRDAQQQAATRDEGRDKHEGE
jgi:hypothetical protein